MRAIVIDQFGQRGSLREVPDPVPGPDDVLVRVSAAGINPVDWKIRDGISGQQRAFPMVLGQDFAGIVERAGERVERLRAGQRVFGVARANGAYAEKTVIPTVAPEQPVAVIPDGLSDEQAAALPTPALTALASIEWLGAKDGSTLLIAGVAGAVGRHAARIAKRRGAHVIGTVRRTGAEEARALGVDEVLDASADDPFAQVKRAHPDGIDLVLDLVDDADAVKKNADILKPGGKLVSTIHVADEAWFTARGIRAYNIVMFQTPQSSPEGLAEVARLALDGTLDVKIARSSPLADAADVLDAVKAGKVGGKAILRP
ncbi:MAG TPA: NADP-dependent oxidoreductase [Candidatus Baltobacteraceae bacterium]|nr:NADP-dependent oxidoreductase [Candidatus Baltobacteraceae bacterium]